MIVHVRSDSEGHGNDDYSRVTRRDFFCDRGLTDEIPETQLEGRDWLDSEVGWYSRVDCELECNWHGEWRT
jgi:hypothetical protein